MKTPSWLGLLSVIIVLTSQVNASEMLASARIVTQQVAKEATPEEQPEREIVLAKKPQVWLGQFWDSSEFRTVTSPDGLWATDEFIWFPARETLFVGVVSEYSISASISPGWPREEPFGLIAGLRFGF